MTANKIGRDTREFDITIASGETESPTFHLGEYMFGSYQLPSAFTGATVTINFSNDGSNWTAVPTLTHESNPETVSADGTYLLPSLAAGALAVQIVSASAEGAARTIKIYLKG